MQSILQKFFKIAFKCYLFFQHFDKVTSLCFKMPWYNESTKDIVEEYGYLQNISQ